MFNDGVVEDALLRLGITTWKRGDELRSNCPMHRERTGKVDENPSWSMNAVTGAHNCFSCGFKGNLVTLVASIKDLDYDEAKSWVFSNLDINLELLAKQLEEIKDSYVPRAQLIPMSEARLAVFSTPPIWALKERELTEDACKKYGVLWNQKSSEWITPIREADTNKLIGWQEKGQISRSFFNRPVGVPKSKTLFGLDAWDGGTMIVVESPLDAVKLFSVGISGGVSTFGAAVSSEQVELMRRADKLILAFDNPKIDAAGKKITADMFGRLPSLGMEASFFAYGSSNKKDIGDMTKEDIEWGIENAKHLVFGSGAMYA